MQDSGVGVATDGGKYWATDIAYNPTSATGNVTVYGLTLAPGEWSVVYPAVPSLTTTTTVTATPVSGAGNNETNIKFTANVSANAGGSVQFKVDGTNFGATKTVAGAGTVDSDLGLIAAGTHSVTATFTAAAPAAYQVGYGNSTGTIASYVVTQLTHPTTTNLSLGSATVAQPSAATGTAVVTNNDTSAVVTAGSVAFTLDGAATPVRDRLHRHRRLHVLAQHLGPDRGQPHRRRQLHGRPVQRLLDELVRHVRCHCACLHP